MAQSIDRKPYDGNYHIRFGERWDQLYNKGSGCKFFLSIASQMTTQSSITIFVRSSSIVDKIHSWMKFM